MKKNLEKRAFIKSYMKVLQLGPVLQGRKYCPTVKSLSSGELAFTPKI